MSAAGLLQHGIPALGALVRAAGLPGWLWGPLGFLFLPLRLYYWESEKKARWLGDYFAGWVFWTCALSFIAHTHPALPFGPGFVLGLWWVLEGRLYFWFRRRLSPGLAAVFAVAPIEFVRAQWPMGGVPWGSLGVGLADQEWGLWLATAIGEHGLAILVLFTGAALYAVLLRQFRDPVLWIAALAWGGAILGAATSEAPPEPFDTVRCLAVQPNLDLELKTSRISEFEVFRANMEPILEACRQRGERPELILWSETMFPFELVSDEDEGLVRRPYRNYEAHMTMSVTEAREKSHRYVEAIGTWLRDGGYVVLGAHFYRGIPNDSPEDRLSPHTSEMLAYDRRARLIDHRAKSRLVPFGESLPFEGALPFSQEVALRIYDYFGLMPDIERVPPGDPLFLPWTRDEEDGDRFALGSTVCWENQFPSVFRAQTERGAEAFCVLSNEAWFGLGTEMDQMLAATRLRAVENGRAVLRCTNTGLTILVDPQGRPGESLPRGQVGALAVDLPRVNAQHRSAYVRWGWVIPPAFAVAALVLLGFCFLRRPESP